MYCQNTFHFSIIKKWKIINLYSFCIISNVHNSCFISFVYFIYFVYFISLIYIYIYLELNFYHSQKPPQRPSRKPSQRPSHTNGGDEDVTWCRARLAPTTMNRRHVWLIHAIAKVFANFFANDVFTKTIDCAAKPRSRHRVMNMNVAKQKSK